MDDIAVQANSDTKPQNTTPPKQADVAEPTPAKVSVGVKPRVKKRVIPSFSISIKPTAQVKEDSTEYTAKKVESAAISNTPLNASALKDAWEALRASVTGDQVSLKQCIKTNLPEVLSDNELSYTVSNNFQADHLKDNLYVIVPFLQEQLKNSNLQMTIKVSEKAESTVVFTSNDKFKLMLEKNPALEQLRKRLDLELD